MSRLNWNLNRDYENGIDRGVFYPSTGLAEVWNGLVSVNEKTSDISERVRYFEGRKVVNHRREDSFSATVSAFSHPPSFLLNPRLPFGLSYRVQTAKGYRIHLIYKALAEISGRNYGQADILEPFSFDISTVPMAVPEFAPSAHLIINTIESYPISLSQIETILYGSDESDPRLPSPIEVFDLFEANAIFKVIDNGDGTFTLDAPDDVFNSVNATTVEVTWPIVTYLNEETYRIRSW
jgi:hypothetical protein